MSRKLDAAIAGGEGVAAVTLDINRIYCMDAKEGLKLLPDDFVDLTVTSPPYDDLRTYKGYSFDFEPIAQELYRITKPGGVVVWVVGDATVKGSETGTSFEQALYFRQLGFRMETMVWEKTGSGCLGSSRYYGQNFEYMFVFAKGTPKTTNLICDRENIVKGGRAVVNAGLNREGKGKNRVIERKPFGKRNNIWRFDTQKNSEHPAPFPEQLAHDHIISWSNPGDLILDPMCGSGTTCKMAMATGRRYIGIDISEEYCEFARKRITEHQQQLHIEE